MDILLVERDRLIRDQVKVGLQQFADFHVTVGEGYAALNELRQRTYDVVFVGAASRAEGKKLITHLRSFDVSTELVVVTSDRNARDMQKDKAQLRISSFLQTPIVASDFFRLMGRLRERRAMEEAQPTAAAATSPRR